ncbi:MAG: hypothetical protein WBC78_15350 [Candidatus Sulfotelmatobacter sp.]
MDSKDFDEFVKHQQEGAAVAVSVDWDKQRDEWLAALNALYAKVESLLHKYVSSGQIRFAYQTVELTEEYLGSYSAKQMSLRIGRQEVLLVPKGTLFIGIKGRVDVVGPAGQAEIFLVDKRASGPASLVHVSFGIGGKLPAAPIESPPKIEWEWKIVTRPPERRFVDITQQSLFQLIMEVANG